MSSPLPCSYPMPTGGIPASSCFSFIPVYAVLILASLFLSNFIFTLVLINRPTDAVASSCEQILGLLSSIVVISYPWTCFSFSSQKRERSSSAGLGPSICYMTSSSRLCLRILILGSWKFISVPFNFVSRELPRK